MTDNCISKRITIVMITGILVFSGLMIFNNWIAGKGQAAIPEFDGPIWYDPAAITTGDSALFSVNITNFGDISACYCVYNITTIDSVLPDNQTATGPTDKNWTYTISIPSNATNIRVKFHAVDTGAIWQSIQTPLLNVIDDEPPAAVAKGTTAVVTTPAKSLTIVEGDSVTFNGKESTDNIGLNEFKWTSDLDGSIYAGPLNTTSTASLTVGSHIITLNVSDAAGNRHIDTMTVTVDNADFAPVLNPQIEVYTANVSALTEDGDFTNITFLGTSSTGNDYIFNYTGPGTISFKFKTPLGSWSTTSYESENLTGEIVTGENNSKIFKIKPKENVYFPADVTENITFNATTSVGSLEYNVSFSVEATNDPPVWNGTDGLIAAFSLDEDTPTQLSMNLFDAFVDTIDNDTADLIFTAEPNDNITVIIEKVGEKYTGNVTFTPDKDWFGIETIKIFANDSANWDEDGLEVNDTIIVTVKPVNDAPVLNDTELPETFSLDEDTPTILGISLFDIFIDPIDNDTADFIFRAEGYTNITVTIDAAGSVTFTPKLNWYGDETITFFANDSANWPSGGLEVNDSIKVSVKSVNDPPDLDVFFLGNMAGAAYSFFDTDPALDGNQTFLKIIDIATGLDVNSTVCNDIDGDALSFSWYIIPKSADPNATNEPNWTKAANANGTNTTYTFSGKGEYMIWLKVTDPAGAYDTKLIDTLFVVPDVPSDDSAETSFPLYFAIILIVALAIAVIVVLMKVKGKKKEEETKKQADDEFAEYGLSLEESQQQDMAMQQQQPGFDQFGQPQQQPGMDQFGQPQQQPGMDQFGQPQQQPGMDQFGQPQQQPGMDQFGQPQQQPGMDQFGQPQQQQPGMDQFGQPQQQPGMGQFGQPQQPPQQQPAMAQFGQPQQPQQQPAMAQLGQPQQPQMQAPGAPMGGRGCPHCGSPVEAGWFLCPNCKNQI